MRYHSKAYLYANGIILAVSDNEFFVIISNISTPGMNIWYEW